MTLLGKWFTAFTCVLSIVFMILALVVNATHRNWRDVVLDPSNGLKKRIEVVEQTNTQLRDSRERIQLALDREQAARRTALAALQTQADQLSQQLQEATARVATLEAKNTELSQLDRSRAEELQRLTEETVSCVSRFALNKKIATRCSLRRWT